MNGRQQRSTVSIMQFTGAVAVMVVVRVVRVAAMWHHMHARRGVHPLSVCHAAAPRLPSIRPSVAARARSMCCRIAVASGTMSPGSVDAGCASGTIDSGITS